MPHEPSSSEEVNARPISENWRHEVVRRREATNVALVGSGGAVLLAIGAWGLIYQNADSLAATVVLGCLIVLVVAIRSGQTPYNLLDPLILFSVVFSVYFVFHVFWLETGQSALGIPGSGRPYADSLPRSQLYAAGAYVAMLFGYVAFRFRSPRQGVSAAAIRSLSAPPLIAIFVLGVAANYAGLRLSTAADTTNALLFRTLGYFALLAFSAALIRHALSVGSSRRVFGYLAYGFMLPVLLVSAFSVGRGSRTDAVFVVLALLSVRAFFVRPVRVRTLAVMAAIALFVVTPTLETLRVQALDESSSVGSVALHHPSHGVLSSTGWELVNRRTNGGESLALAVKYSPVPLPYQHGRSWTNLAYLFVPHFIWPSKPSGDLTTEFSRDYGGLSAARGHGLTLAPTVPADFYLNFGLIGLLIGFFVLGVYIRGVTGFAGSDPFAVLLYVALVAPLILIDDGIAGNMSILLTRLAATLCFVGMIRSFALRATAKNGKVSG